MKFIPINKSKWARAQEWEFYMTRLVLSYDLNADLDVTHFAEAIKAKGLTFYPSMCWAVARVVNNHPEFRMSLDETKWLPFGSPEILTAPLGYFETLMPSYTILHKDTETISVLHTPWNESLMAYHDAQRADMERYKDSDKMNPMADEPLDILNLSCLPWLNYNSLNMNILGSHTYLRPVITWGKYVEKEGGLKMPMSFHIHHAACDGHLASLFYIELQQILDSIESCF